MDVRSLLWRLWCVFWYVARLCAAVGLIVLPFILLNYDEIGFMSAVCTFASTLAIPLSSFMRGKSESCHQHFLLGQEAGRVWVNGENIPSTWSDIEEVDELELWNKALKNVGLCPQYFALHTDLREMCVDVIRKLPKDENLRHAYAMGVVEYLQRCGDQNKREGYSKAHKKLSHANCCTKWLCYTVRCWKYALTSGFYEYALESVEEVNAQPSQNILHELLEGERCGYSEP